MSGAPTFLALPARQPKPQAPLLPPARAHMLLDPVILGHHPRCQHALHQRTPSSQIRTPYSCAGVEVMRPQLLQLRECIQTSRLCAPGIFMSGTLRQSSGADVTHAMVM